MTHRFATLPALCCGTAVALAFAAEREARGEVTWSISIGRAEVVTVQEGGKSSWLVSGLNPTFIGTRAQSHVLLRWSVGTAPWTTSGNLERLESATPPRKQSLQSYLPLR